MTKKSINLFLEFVFVYSVLKDNLDISLNGKGCRAIQVTDLDLYRDTTAAEWLIEMSTHKLWQTNIRNLWTTTPRITYVAQHIVT